MMFSELPEFQSGDHLTRPPTNLLPETFADIEGAKQKFLKAVSKAADPARQKRAAQKCFDAACKAVAREYTSDFSTPDDLPLADFIWNGNLRLVFEHEVVRDSGLEGTLRAQAPVTALRALLVLPEFRQALRVGTDAIIKGCRKNGTAARIAGKREDSSERGRVHRHDTPAQDIRVAAIWDLLGGRAHMTQLEQEMRCEITDSWRERAADQRAGLAQESQGAPRLEVAVISDRELARRYAIALACQQQNVTEIRVALIDSGIPASECVQLAQSYAIAAAENNQKDMEGIRVRIENGMTVGSASVDEADPLIVSDEGMAALLGWSVFAAVQAMNGDHKPSAADQAIIDGLRAQAADQPLVCPWQVRTAIDKLKVELEIAMAACEPSVGEVTAVSEREDVRKLAIEFFNAVWVTLARGEISTPGAARFDRNGISRQVFKVFLEEAWLRRHIKEQTQRLFEQLVEAVPEGTDEQTRLAALEEFFGLRTDGRLAKLENRAREDVVQAIGAQESAATEGQPAESIKSTTDEPPSTEEVADETQQPSQQEAGTYTRTSKPKRAIEHMVVDLNAQGKDWEEVCEALHKAGHEPKHIESRTGWELKADSFPELYSYPRGRDKNVSQRLLQWFRKVIARALKAAA